MTHLQELHTQDNLGTADPLFVVFEKERIYNIDDGDGYEWRSAEDWNEADEEGAIALEKLVDALEETQLDGVKYVKSNYIERDRFVTACFTRKGAEDYLAVNGHNLTRPFIYVSSLHRNQEMIEVRKHLMATRRPQSPWQPDPKR